MKDHPNVNRIWHKDVIQGSPEWHEIRSGLVTGSVGATLLVNGKSRGGLGAGTITEMYRVAEERMTGIPRENFGSSKGTDWGHEYEPEAIVEYERRELCEVEAIGFVERVEERSGTSPDGLIRNALRGLEIKSYPVNHLKLIDTVGKDDLPTAMKKEWIQCQWNLWATAYEAWDLALFHPRIPQKSRLKVWEILPDPEFFDQMEKRIEIFNTQVDLVIKAHQ